MCQRVLVSGEPDTAELRLAGAGSGEVPVSVVASAVREAHGDARSLLLMVEDLRERKRTAAALERAAAERAARGEAEALAGRLARVAAITDGLDAMALDELVQELCRRLHEVLGARGAAVRVIDPGGAVVADAERGSVERRAARCARRSPTAAARSSSTTAPSRCRCAPPASCSARSRSAARTGRRRPASAPRSIAHATERAALIIRRALLLEREQHVASTLQHDLLPHSLPELPGVSLAAHFRAGGHGIEVGRRLVRRDPAGRRARRARRGRRRRPRRGGRRAHGPAAQRRARLRARGPLPGRVRRSA